MVSAYGVLWRSYTCCLCSAPPVGSPYALLCLANNTAMGGTLRTMRERFDKLFK